MCPKIMTMMSLKSRILAMIKKTKTTTSNPPNYYLLEPAAKIRLALCSSIEPDGFLSLTHYNNYTGLFLSCKQINPEMECEAVRARYHYHKRYAASMSEDATTDHALPLTTHQFRIHCACHYQHC